MKKRFNIIIILFITLMMIPFLNVKAYEYDSGKSDVPSLRVFEDGTVTYDKSKFYDMYVSLKYDESNNYLTSIFQTITDESFNIIDLIENECPKNMAAFNCRVGLEGTYDLLIRAGSYNSEFSFTYKDGKITGSIVEQKYVLTIKTNEPTSKVTYNNKDYSNGDTLSIAQGEQISMFAKAGAGYRFDDAICSDTNVTVNGSIGRIITMPNKDVTITFNFKQIPEYEASLDSLDLGTVVKGYEPNDFNQIFRVNVTGTNALNADINHFKVELTSGDTEAFDLWVNNGGTFNSGSTYNAGSIKPVSGLEKGKYNATYTLYYDIDGEENEFDFTELATGTVSLKVSENAYILTILTNDSTCKVLYNSEEYSSGDTISIPEYEEVRLYAKAASGFVFSQALSNDTTIQKNGTTGIIITMPEKDVTVTFNFTKLPKVIFESNGGSNIDSVVYTYGLVYIDMPIDPEKAGYTFMGWYSDKEFKNEFDFDIEHELIDDLTLYAKWKSDFMTPTVKISANNNKLTINWDTQKLATKYEVSYSTDKKKWIKKDVTTDNYVISGLTYNKTYYFRVRAFDGSKWSKYSDIVSKKIKPNKVKLNIVSAGSNNVKLSWEKVSVTGYEVQRSTDNKKWTKVTTITKSSTLEYNNKKLKENKTYYYKVRAYKTVSGKKIYGSWSNVVSTKTAPVKPSVSLSIKSLTEMNIKISSSKGASVYQVGKSLDGKTYTLLDELNSAGTLVASELELNKTYYFRVRVCNSQNRCSGWTTVNKKHTLKTPSLSLKSPYKGQVTVKIGEVDGAEGFAIEYSTDSKKGFKKVTNINSSINNYTHESSSLKSKKVFYYRVRAYRVVDGKTIYSPWSKVKSVKINTKVLIKLKSIKLNIANKIAVNDTKNIIVTYNPTDKVETITWESSDESIAQVDNGKVTGIEPGNVTITATTSSGITSSVNIIIYKPADSFTLNKDTINMYIGDSENLIATITPDDATFKEVTYKSMNTSIATINSDGLIKALAEGTTKIIVSTEEGISKECTINIKEKPIEFSGSGDKIISNVNIPKGEYVARITFESDSSHSVKFYYGSGEYDYELLVNKTEPYSGVTLLKGGRTQAVTNGIFEVKTDGPWTITVEKIYGNISFPANGTGDTITGVFDGTGKQEIFDITIDSDSYNGVKIHKYNGGEYDYELLVNETNPYNGKVMFRTEKGYKYYLEILTEGSWSIKREQIPTSVTFPINGSGDSVTGLFDGTGNKIVFNVNFDADSYNGLTIYKYKGDMFDYDLLVNEADPYNGQVLVHTEKGYKYFFVVKTEGSWSISK